MAFLDPSLQDAVHGTVNATGVDAIEPLLSGAPDTIIQTAAAVTFLIFLLIIGLLMRNQLVRNRRAADAADAKFFQPAGDEAEIVFDEEVRSETKRIGQEKLRAENELELLEDSLEEDMAEVIIERPDQVQDEQTGIFNTPVETPKKKQKFAGLFSKNKKTVETAYEAEDTLGFTNEGLEESQNDPLASTRGSLLQDEANERDNIQAEEEAALRRRAEAEAEAIRRREEEDARMRADEIEKQRLAEEKARRAAEREVEFERRKQEALREQELTRAAAIQENDRTRELEERINALTQQLESQATPVPAAMPAAAFMSSDAEQGHTSNDDIERIFQRLNEHREAVDESLASMAQRLNQIAGTPSDVEALRSDIAALRGTMGGRITSTVTPSVQLADIVRNALPPDAYEINALLPNNRKADCLVRLSNPPGPIAIDASFPVEAYNRLQRSLGTNEIDELAENEFRRVALRHVVDIAERMIVPNETADSALMFTPSESIYAELHARFPDVIQDSYRARVWVVSPTTLMATLHTIRAVVRDADVRENASFIHSEAREVLTEVEDLRRRVGALEKNFDQTRNDVRDIINSTDLVFRRAESITRSGQSMQEPAIGTSNSQPTQHTRQRNPYRDQVTNQQPIAPQQARHPMAQSHAAERQATRPNEPDLWENETGKQIDPPSFPLR